ncbi:MAG: tetratricopeptide repeat protein [Pseudanabaena sp. ELA607]|jgi:tetratricopeptide (TPR) repeat protein
MKSQNSDKKQQIWSRTSAIVATTLTGTITGLALGLVEPSWSLANNNEQTNSLGQTSQNATVAQTSARSYWQRGVKKEMSGDYEGAVADFTKAIEIDPNYAPAYDSRGIAHFRLGNNVELALADFSKAIELDPENVNAYSNRCSAYRILKKWRDAASDCDRAVEIAPDFPNVYNSRGNLRIDMKQYQGAIADFNRAIELKPDIGQPYYNRGRAYRIQGRNDEALEDFRQAAILYKKAGNRRYYLDAVRAVQELEDAKQGGGTEG